MSHKYVEPSWIRKEIVDQFLEKFESALPLFKEMISVAHTINSAAGNLEAKRLGKIMHAAIRCASRSELRILLNLFSLIGNYPVNYYDLRERVSVECTAFRPTSVDEMKRNGFRIFCSVLSMQCIPVEHQAFVKEIISRRAIFDNELLTLIQTGKKQGGLSRDQAGRLITKCVNLFTRPQEALVSLDEYRQLREINKVAAQILISNSLAFNHLTPSVASVPAAHDEMQRRGIKTIPVWQGPVGKDFILRQTSCLAPPIVLKFPNFDGSFTAAEYQETFVEFEERLQALTPKGRKKFEALFAKGKQNLTLPESDPDYAEHYYETMRAALSEFPSSQLELWRHKLAYFTFNFSASQPTLDSETETITFNQAIENGLLLLQPQQYEDFFGPAATNIFNSNIGLEDVSNVGVSSPDSQEAFELELGRPVINMYDYYAQIQRDSKSKVLQLCSQIVDGASDKENHKT